MHIWQKFVTPAWLARNEPALDHLTSGRHAVVNQSNRKRISIECACQQFRDAQELRRKFGGTIRALSADWLAKYLRQEKRKPLTIGKRLLITNMEGAPSPHGRPSRLVIPAGAAFGTGDHATTAMSLRFLEEITRKMKTGWSLVDLGTGSGILALAGKCFGAHEILAIDNDAQAIRTAKQNARNNKIRGIDFQIGDALKLRDRNKKFDLITANLFSDLLLKALPVWKTQLKRDGFMILSGIFRKQELHLVRALRHHRFSVLKIRHRGKWVAILAGRLRRS